MRIVCRLKIVEFVPPPCRQRIEGREVGAFALEAKPDCWVMLRASVKVWRRSG